MLYHSARATKTNGISAKMLSVKDYFLETRQLFDHALADADFLRQVEAAVTLFTQTLQSGRKVLLAGNGGSAADAQHIAGELVSRFYFDRPSLPGLALTTDTSILTAIGNDYGYEHVFSRQVQGLGQPGDLFVGISTSGRSPNIVAACQAARAKGLKVLGLTGVGGGVMPEHCDLVVRAPSASTPMIQQVHIVVGHILCALAEQALFGSEAAA
jgi:D-sedoheptulose 7-phosphate isomerase